MKNYYITDYNPDHIDADDLGEGYQGITVESQQLPEVEESIEDPYNPKESSSSSSEKEPEPAKTKEEEEEDANKVLAKMVENNENKEIG